MKLLDKMRSVLQADGVQLEAGEDELRFHSRSHNFSLTMRALEGNGVLLLVSNIPIFAPVYRRAEVCEALTRANYGLWMGAFEMDLSDGEIRFPSGCPWRTQNQLTTNCGGSCDSHWASSGSMAKLWSMWRAPMQNRPWQWRGLKLPGER